MQGTQLVPLTLLLVVMTTACSKENTPAVMNAADREFLDRAKAKERAKAAVKAAPWDYVTGGRWHRYDKGIINTYTRATQIEFTNNSQFDVSDLQGKITYIGSSGSELASVPFTATGEVRANSTATLTVQAGEISGAAASARIVVERARVRE